MLTWATRRQCTNKTDALEVLASLPKTHYEVIIEGSPDSSLTLLGRISEFAEHWEIPFNLDTMHDLALQAGKDDGYWDESYDDYDYGSPQGWYSSFC